jgi:hypothetical protein
VQAVTVEGGWTGEDFWPPVARAVPVPGRRGDDPSGEEGSTQSLASRGERALAIDVVKQQGANTVEVARDPRGGRS